MSHERPDAYAQQKPPTTKIGKSVSSFRRRSNFKIETRNATNDAQNTTREINNDDVRAKNRPKIPAGMKNETTTVAIAAAAQRRTEDKRSGWCACVCSQIHPFL